MGVTRKSPGPLVQLHVSFPQVSALPDSSFLRRRLYAETVLKDRGKGGNIRNTIPLLSSSNLSLARRKKRPDMEMVTDEISISSDDKETQTDNSEVQMMKYDRQVRADGCFKLVWIFLWRRRRRLQQ